MNILDDEKVINKITDKVYEEALIGSKVLRKFLTDDDYLVIDNDMVFLLTSLTFHFYFYRIILISKYSEKEIEKILTNCIIKMIEPLSSDINKKNQMIDCCNDIFNTLDGFISEIQKTSNKIDLSYIGKFFIANINDINIEDVYDAISILKITEYFSLLIEDKKLLSSIKDLELSNLKQNNNTLDRIIPKGNTYKITSEDIMLKEETINNSTSCNANGKHHAEQNNNMENSLPMNWFNFWKYARLPLGLFLNAINSFTFLYYLNSPISIALLVANIIIVLFMSITLYYFFTRKKEGYNFLMAWLFGFEWIINTFLIAFSYAISDSLTSINVSSFIITYLLALLVSGLIWILPNFIYFKKRKSYFNKLGNKKYSTKSNNINNTKTDFGFCSNCGADLDYNKKCANCGKQYVGEKQLLWAFLICSIVIIIGLSIFAYYSYSELDLAIELLEHYNILQ